MCFTIFFCLFSVTSITNPQNNLSFPVHIPCLPLYDLCDALYSTIFDLHRFLSILLPTGSQTAHENQKQSVLFSYSRRFFNDTRLFVIYGIFFYKYLCNRLCLLILGYNRYPLYNVFNFVL